MPTCTECGQPLRAGARFCTSCGRPAAAQAPPQAQQTQQADEQSAAQSAAQRSEAASIAQAATAQAQSAATAADSATPVAAQQEALAAAPGHVAQPAPAAPTGPAPGLPHGATTATPQTPQDPQTPASTDATAASPYPAAGSPYPAAGSPYPEPGAAGQRQFNAQAFTDAAGQARSRVGAQVERIPLPVEQINRALRDGALLALAAWGVGVAITALVDVFSEGDPAPILWARNGIVMLALVLRASVSLGMSLGDTGLLDGVLGSSLERALGDVASARGSVTFMPLAVSALLMAVVFVVARRANLASATGSTRDRLIRAALMGGSFGVLAMVLAVVLRGPVAPATDAILAANWLQVLLGGLVLVGLAAFAGFGVGAADSARIPAAWAADLRTAAEMLIAPLTTVSGLAVVALLYGLATQASAAGGSGSASPRDVLVGLLMALLVLLLLAPTMLVLAAGLLIGGTVMTSASMSTGLLGADTGGAQRAFGVGIIEGGLDGKWSLAMIALTVCGAALVGLRAATRSSADAGGRLRWWQPALLAAGAWLVLAWLATVSVSAEGSSESSGGLFGVGAALGRSAATGAASLGLSPFMVAIAAGVWTAAAVWLGHRFAPYVGASAPTMLARIGGKRLDLSWQVLLADALLRRGQVPPKRLEPVAQELRSGRLAPPARPL